MRITMFLSVVVGLCLAIFSVGCNGGLTAPPIVSGEVIITDNGDGQLISNEPVLLSWDFVPGTDRFVVEYSINGNVWIPAGETQLISMDWKIPTGIDSDGFIVRADSYSDQHSSARNRAMSIPTQILPYGSIASTIWVGDTESAVYLEFNSKFTLNDQYGNVVLAPHSIIADIWWYDNIQWSIWGDYNRDGIESPDETWDHGPGWIFDESTGFYSALDSFSEKGLFIYKISVDGKDLFLPSQPTEAINIFSNGVYFDFPTSETSWIIGEANDIVIRAGGETMVDILDFDYSPDDGLHWKPIQHGVTGVDGWVMPQPFTYNWEIPNDTSGQWKVRVSTYDTNGDFIATGTSDAFTVTH